MAAFGGVQSRVRRHGAIWVLPFVGAVALAQSGCTDCDGYEDEAPGAPVVLQIHNERDNPIFLRTPECTYVVLPFDVTTAAGEPLSLRPSGCGTCQKRQETTGMCDAMCVVAPTILVEPGGSYPLSWSGQHYVAVEMPDSCYFDFPSETCSQRVNADAGGYEISVHATEECVGGGPAELCTCGASTDGWCQVTSLGTSGGSALQQTVTVTLPAAAPIDVTFGP